MRISSKKFLTDHPHENGSIVWHVTTPKKERNPLHQGCNIEAEIQVRDCHSVPVCINFYTNKEESVKKRIKKIDTFIEELVKFKEAYLKGVEDQVKLRKWAKTKETDD